MKTLTSIIIPASILAVTLITGQAKLRRPCKRHRHQVRYLFIEFRMEQSKLNLALNATTTIEIKIRVL